ncbi:MAG: hypothetical protein IIU35_05815 [Neisseriaceae bacterium]|nr:hypothetical protein [Neisseriaceae bacterium]
MNELDTRFELGKLIHDKVKTKVVEDVIRQDLNRFLHQHFGIVDSSLADEILFLIEQDKRQAREISDIAGRFAHPLVINFIFPFLVKKNYRPFIR